MSSTVPLTPVLFQDNFAHPEIEWGQVTNDPRCGVSAIRRSVAQRRIVGGDEAGCGTFPWQALIRIGKAKVRHIININLRKCGVCELESIHLLAE